MQKDFCDLCGKVMVGEKGEIIKLEATRLDEGKKPAMIAKEICVWCFQKIKLNLEDITWKLQIPEKV